MPSADEIVSHAQELLRRVSPEGRRQAQRRRERRRRQLLKLSRRMMAAAAIVLGAMIAWGLVIGPVGQTGLMIAMLVLGIAWFVILGRLRTPEPGIDAPAAVTDLVALPSRTEDWLDRQRALLPAPAQRPLDAIAVQLEALGLQLDGIDPREPAAVEVRRLVGDELPELVRNYQKVPQALRRTPRDGGPSPDRQLVDGLGLIGEEIARMNRELAAGDLNALATQGRYLELKYRDGELGGGN